MAGTERYCEGLSRRLLERGHECLVLAGSMRRAPEATLATVDQDGLLVSRYLRVQGQAHRWTEEYDPGAEGLTRGLLSLVQPDVVHLHHWKYLTNNLVAICAERGIPVVVTLHEVWTSCPRVHRIRWDGAFCADPVATAPCLTCAERGLWQGEQEIASALALRREMLDAELALAAAIIVPSEAHRAFLLGLLDLPPDRLTVLPHGSIPTVGLRESPGTQSGFPNRPLQIGHWGHLMYLKGPHLILEAVHKLREPSAVQVHLIGTTIEQEPGYEPRLRDLARGIPVQFHGAYRPADLQAFDLDLAVLPSITSESYSFTLDEALRLGLPVLVSDRGALPERIGAAGLTFRAGDADDLARRLQEILDAPEVLATLRRGIRPEALFSMEAHVAMLEKIYDDAAHANRPKGDSPTPYLKLIAHAQQQVREREEALARFREQLAIVQPRLQELEAERAALQTQLASLAQEREGERAHLYAELARVAEERAADAQARQAAEAERAALQTQLASLAQERDGERAHLYAELARVAEECAADAQARQAAEAERSKVSEQLASLEKARIIQVQELELKISALIQTRDDLIRRVTELERTPVGRLQTLLQRWDLLGGGKRQP